MEAERLVEKFVKAGYIDDAVYARSRSRSLTTRGYGANRVEMTLRQAGIDEPVRHEAASFGKNAAHGGDDILARKRGFGPYARDKVDPGAAENREEARQRRMAARKAACRTRSGRSFFRQCSNRAPRGERGGA